MRILLVEDKPNAAKMLAKGLRKQTYAVDVARDGQEAVHLASVNDYDLIILDVMLPLKDGFEVCGDLRAGGSSVPILMLTARDAAQDRIAGLDTGADDYLTKPSERARRIGAANLDERLPVANSRDELGQMAATFNELLGRLSRAFAQQQFMADASHELRAPVSVIRTASEATEDVAACAIRRPPLG